MINPLEAYDLFRGQEFSFIAGGDRLDSLPMHFTKASYFVHFLRL